MKPITNFMIRLFFLFLIPFLFACNQENHWNSENQPSKINQYVVDTTKEDYEVNERFNSFDTLIQVVFWNTKESISNLQKKNYEGFILRQDLLTPEILNKIFEFYKSSYNDYKKGWTMMGGISDKELEKYLPIPTTPENLKAFITPAIVHIQNKQDCIEGTIGIEFDCSWDIENGLGVSIKNWKVVKAGLAEVSYY
jgi:hypothetical protein